MTDKKEGEKNVKPALQWCEVQVRKFMQIHQHEDEYWISVHQMAIITHAKIHYGHRVWMQWLINVLIHPIICSFMSFLNWVPSLHFHYITSDDGVPPDLRAKHDELWLWPFHLPLPACSAVGRGFFCNWWRLTAKALCGVPSWLGVYSWGLKDHYLASASRGCGRTRKNNTH